MSIKINGVADVLKTLQKVRRQYPRAMAVALYQNGADILSDSVKRTPVQYGVLRSSAYVAPAAKEEQPVIELGYGTHYAPKVHEMTNARHPRGGEAKFLQNALDAYNGKYLSNLASRALAAVESGARVGTGAFPKRPTEGHGLETKDLPGFEGGATAHLRQRVENAKARRRAMKKRRR